ncbi:MAG: aminoglycoside phosphotransferase family protein, partial [Bacteroidales bacterium]
HLALSGKLLPYMIGLRFLTDYVDGDNYFKIKHEHHNLQRARAQFKLLQSMERQFGEMREVVGRSS